MEFKAHIFAQRYFGWFLVSLMSFTEALCIFNKAYVGASIFAGLVIAAYVRLNQRTMSFSADEFKYDGWLRSFSVPYRDILNVEHSSKTGFHLSRWYGPVEYRLTMKAGKKWVNLIWFNAEANRYFHDRILKRNEAH